LNKHSWKTKQINAEYQQVEEKLQMKKHTYLHKSVVSV